MMDENLTIESMGHQLREIADKEFPGLHKELVCLCVDYNLPRRFYVELCGIALRHLDKKHG